MHKSSSSLAPVHLLVDLAMRALAPLFCCPSCARLRLVYLFNFLLFSCRLNIMENLGLVEEMENRGLVEEAP